MTHEVSRRNGAMLTPSMSGHEWLPYRSLDGLLGSMGRGGTGDASDAFTPASAQKVGYLISREAKETRKGKRKRCGVSVVCK